MTSQEIQLRPPPKYSVLIFSHYNFTPTSLSWSQAVPAAGGRLYYYHDLILVSILIFKCSVNTTSDPGLIRITSLIPSNRNYAKYRNTKDNWTHPTGIVISSRMSLVFSFVTTTSTIVVVSLCLTGRWCLIFHIFITVSLSHIVSTHPPNPLVYGI